MKKLFTIAYLFSIHLSLFSQDMTRIKLQSPDFTITAITNLSYGSTSINNNFINKLAFGGHIDNDLKNKAKSKTKKNNRIGIEFNYEFKFYNLRDTFLRTLPNYKYYFGFGSFDNTSAKFSNDFFEILFYGNKNFIGKTAHLGNTTIFQSSFKKISFGLINIKTKTSIGISLISGEKHNYLDLETAELKTSSNAQEINLNYSGLVQASDSIKNGFLSFSGAGLALDFSTQFKNLLNLSVTNLGFATWNRNPSQTSFNKTLNFDGFYIDKPFNNNGDFSIRESIDTIIPQLESKTITELLPAIFKIESIVKDDKKIQAIYGIRYKILSNYLPLIHVGGFYKINSNIGLSAAVLYGGYNKTEGLLNVFYRSEKLHFGIGTNNLIGNFSKNGFGKSLHLSLMANF